ncbi:Serine/threonine protein kinase [Chondrus crispus]|uniref:Serine/threonine protein kinase n=1 Tax=Chondrus crispus TaxID=2769 RepID=R7QPI8_CHOCR|nr:Serine/threonine protein kinase [Chondrus crispus]CDF39401.1 Serine/threonine protein kinase [Chondrus crispus]|eukprot:XP_005719312.1 Serine/threonine protein kinase [Chondrus crispus]
MRTDSMQSGIGAGNPIAALRVTFMSIKSYGNTEISSGSLGEDTNGFVGAAYRSRWSNSDMGLGGAGSFPRSFRNTWSTVGLPSKVEEAAGSYYCAGPIDKHWTIKGKLGEGAFSEVRLGEGKAGEGMVAIKIVSKGAPDLFCPEGACREVVSCQLFGHHPNLVQCIQIFEDDRFIYIVMELLIGGQMLPRVADTHFYPRYCENDVVTLVRGLTRALTHLHKLGIAHRDVKPENILYASETLDPTVKLTDFGIAHTRCKTTPAHDMVGTPLYVAPEVLLRKPYGCAADMWSLGVIVHILLTGYPPFDDDDLVQLIKKVKSRPLRMIGEEWVVISEDARDFVEKLLTRDVPNRLSAEQAMAHPWLATPRPPPFPAPPMPSRPLNPPARVQVPPTRKSRQDGTIPLMVAQINLNSFVVRKEWKRMVESEPSERNKLSMLVSLSEKELGIPNPLSLNSTREVSTDTNLSTQPAHALPSESSIVNIKQQVPGMSVSSARPPKQGASTTKREKSNGDRPLTDLERQQEQERLRQRRLQVQAELSKKKKLQAMKVEEAPEKVRSISTETVSTHSEASNKEASDNQLLSTSQFSDDGTVVSEVFQSRRDADAEGDVKKIQKQRAELQHASKPRALIGRRARQSNSTRQSVKSEKPKPPKAKGVRVRKRQKQVVPLLQGTKLANN